MMKEEDREEKEDEMEDDDREEEEGIEDGNWEEEEESEDREEQEEEDEEQEEQTWPTLGEKINRASGGLCCGEGWVGGTCWGWCGFEGETDGCEGSGRICGGGSGGEILMGMERVMVEVVVVMVETD